MILCLTKFNLQYHLQIVMMLVEVKSNIVQNINISEPTDFQLLFEIKTSQFLGIGKNKGGCKNKLK